MQKQTRTTAAWITALATTALTLGLISSSAPVNAAPAGAKLPAKLATYKSPLPEQRTKEVINATAAKYGPGKRTLPRFKAESTGDQRRAAIKGIDKIARIAKADASASVLIKDSVKVWEAMTPGQKDAVLSQTDAVVAVWPAGVAATAAAVAAGAAVVDIAYKVYVDQREEAEEDAKEADAEGEGDGDGGDGGDTGTDTGAIRAALAY